MNILLFIYILLGSAASNIINYSKEDYVLIEDTNNIFLYETYGELYHVTNLSFYKSIIDEEVKYVKDNNISTDWDFYLQLKLATSLLVQLTPHKRIKRSINELGTIFKWITGTPDHNDMVTIQNKVNDLIVNNNKQNKINSAIFKEIGRVTRLLSLKLDKEFLLKKYRLQLLSKDLQTLRDAITFSKAKILYSNILNDHDVANIFTNEKFNITLIDLIDVSIFSIVSYKGLIIFYIKYPIVNNNCNLYHAKAISQQDGKLLIEDKVAKCNNTFHSIQIYKKEIYSNFAQLRNTKNCFVNLLNKEFTRCKKIKEKNRQIEIITDGAILVTGMNYVNHTLIAGIYVITFETIVDINNKTYTNTKQKLLNYIENNRFTNFLISEYLQSNNSELTFENTNILSPIIVPLKNNHVQITLVIILIIFVFFTLKLLKNLFPNLCPNIGNFIKQNLVTKRNTNQIPEADLNALKSLNEKIDQLTDTP